MINETNWQIYERITQLVSELMLQYPIILSGIGVEVAIEECETLERMIAQSSNVMRWISKINFEQEINGYKKEINKFSSLVIYNKLKS